MLFTTKGECIEFCEQNSADIKVIDTAVPVEVYKDLPADVRHRYVTVYYVDGGVSYLDIVTLTEEIYNA